MNIIYLLSVHHHLDCSNLCARTNPGQSIYCLLKLVLRLIIRNMLKQFSKFISFFSCYFSDSAKLGNPRKNFNNHLPIQRIPPINKISHLKFLLRIIINSCLYKVWKTNRAHKKQETPRKAGCYKKSIKRAARSCINRIRSHFVPCYPES